MKKHILILLLIVLASTITAGEITDYSGSFFGVYGRRASIMGTIDGSACEIWIYPYKVLHDLEFRVLVDGAEEDPYSRLGNFKISHLSVERNFVGEKWTIAEQLYPAYASSAAFLVYRVNALTGVTLEFFFKPDLSPMWPASIGGKYSYYNKEGYFVLSESTSRNTALFGGFPGQKVGALPAHKLPGGKLRYRIPLKKGRHEIPLLAVAARDKYQPVKETFLKMRQTHGRHLKERETRVKEFIAHRLRVKTPEQWLNKALEQAMLNVDFAFVDNPDLGEGLIAGYGLSGERERPGFAWYFGGDGLINSYAVVNYGDFQSARKELEFLLKYQRKDGKIMHELSQGAAFIDWFGDYGFPFFHGDTTLYYASFLAFYLERSGDTEFFTRHRKKIDKIFSWMLACDSDKDGIMETKLAGVGASETGPLRQEMKTDIYLASLSVKAWQAMARLYGLLKDDKKVKIANRRFKNAGEALEKYFWNEESRYYAYALKEDGGQVGETTVWPAIGLRYNVLPKQKGQLARRKIASPELSADWGTRFLSSRSQYYDPSSYNNGAVWPFLTGFSSLALYNYGNPYHGFSLLLANLHIVKDYDYGAPTELLSGEIYRPLDQSVPNQVWSSGNTIPALVEGLLGLDADALRKTIRLQPAVPMIWPYLEVDNLAVGTGKMNLRYKRQGNRLEYVIDFDNLEGYTFTLSPALPALEKTFRLDGMEVPALGPVTVKSARQTVRIGMDVSGYVYPFIEKRLEYGAVSREPIIENFQLKDGECILDIWGKGTVELLFHSDRKLRCPGASIGQKGDAAVFTLEFGEEWRRKTLIISIGNKEF
jgi:glycogen debranching enzyme